MQLSGATAWAFWGGLAVIIGGMMGGAFLDERRRRRRTYWLCWLAGGLILTLGVGAQDPDRALLIAGFCAVMSVMTALFRTPYLKIGNTIYALRLDDRQPDPPEDGEPAGPRRPRPADSYGNLSAGTFWWLMAIMIAMSAFVVWHEGWAGKTGAAAAIFIFGTAVAGFADSSGGFARFRGQYAPAAVLTLVSIPLYCSPPLLYLLCYEIGRWLKGRRPPR